MKVAILGTGNMGTALGKALAPKHQIIYGSRTPQSKLEWAASIGKNVQVVSQQEAIDTADITLVTLNWPGNTVIETLTSLKNLNGKIMVDVTNVLKPDYSPLKFENSDSGAEEIQRHLPDSIIVKAFNTASGFSILNQSLQFGDKTVNGFYAGDNQKANAIVAELLKDAGFNPLYSGGLANAIFLESLGQFLIALAFQQNLGVDIGWTLLTRT
ncbi:NAD(P)-binding domain-containing protein [Flavobacterium sp.]|uniref:NADPH-dependent F420 reductase n=1 Tax=Flavobacterium sp. TaxID=239 RepID=UPI002610CBB7|nr:NAD(P)-binding domain-containing protein [Flavobacterium sp.]